MTVALLTGAATMVAGCAGGGGNSPAEQACVDYVHAALTDTWSGNTDWGVVQQVILSDKGQGSREYAAFMGASVNMRAVTALHDGDPSGAWFHAQGDVGASCRGES